MTITVATAPPMPSDLFALQIAFARRVVAVTDLSLPDALLQYTTCYSATGLRHPFTPDRDAPEWRDFLADFLVAEDQAAYVHTAYLVHGQSWLYNLPAYCRLFPPAFVSAPIPVPGEYTVLSSWGPFMDHHGGVKPDLATAFHTAIASAITLDALLACFPYRILSVSCDIAHFYTHYGVAPP